ncbi:putative transcriptional regulators [Candidatus Termititenax aidoneus]|uniref:Transcriptional regulators n=1 Tax=Termititenax aidoneus TaxID=2218524 RepID=A0A388T8M7_TERA1|nr:putative transcriptional regulators [Candidatus Termititenax aidoneus]
MAIKQINPEQAQHLKNLLKQKQISLEKMGKALGVSFQLVHQYTTGRCNPSPETMAEMAKVLSVPLCYMYIDCTQKALEVISNYFQQHGFFVKKEVAKTYSCDLLCLSPMQNIIIAANVKKTSTKKFSDSALNIDFIEQSLRKTYNIKNCVFLKVEITPEKVHINYDKKLEHLPSLPKLLKALDSLSIVWP